MNELGIIDINMMNSLQATTMEYLLSIFEFSSTEVIRTITLFEREEIKCPVLKFKGIKYDLCTRCQVQSIVYMY